MKTRLLALIIVLLSALPAKAQDSYVVQPGDTLYQLASIHKSDPLKWGEVLGANPFLKEPGRVFEKDGKTIVLIRPGEMLAGLTTLGIDFEVLPADKLKLPETVTDVPAQAGINWPVVIAVLIAIVIGCLITLGLNRHVQKHEDARVQEELRRDPVTSGPPIVAGGVQPNETVRLSQAMEAAAVSDYVRLNPNVNRIDVRVERRGPVEEGMISGTGMVGYADRARPRTIDPALPGYRARFRFQDGREDVLMSLQGCMNPVYIGEGMSGFTFTPRQEVVPAPQPPAPAPQAVPHPAMAIARIRAAAEAEGVSTIVVGGKVITVERGAHFDLDSTPGSVKITGGAFETTFKLKPTRKATKASAPKTGTGKQ